MPGVTHYCLLYFRQLFYSNLSMVSGRSSSCMKNITPIQLTILITIFWFSAKFLLFLQKIIFYKNNFMEFLDRKNEIYELERVLNAMYADV